MIIVWRPPFGLTRDGSEGTYEGNEAIIRVAKEKPKGASKKGDYQFFYDKKRNSYYYKEHDEMIYSTRDLNIEQLKIQETPVDEQAFHSNSSFSREEDDNSIPF